MNEVTWKELLPSPQELREMVLKDLKEVLDEWYEGDAEERTADDMLELCRVTLTSITLARGEQP